MTLIEEYNKQAIQFLNWNEKTYKQLQKTQIWKNARSEVMRIRKVNINCEVCGHGASPLYMHHIKYDFSHIFNPRNIIFICKKCNARIHYKKWTL